MIILVLGCVIPSYPSRRSSLTNTICPFGKSSLEKPRSDFKELVIHHIVTLWLVGWSCE